MRVGIILMCAALALSTTAMGAKNAALDRRPHPATTLRDAVRSPAAAVARVRSGCHLAAPNYPWRAELSGRTWSVWQIYPSRKSQKCSGGGASVDRRTGKVRCFHCIL